MALVTATMHTPIPPGFHDSAFAEFSMEFRVGRGSAEFRGIPQFGTENHGKGDFPWHWEKFPFSEGRTSIFEHGIFIS